MRNFHDLEVWHKAHHLVLLIYQCTCEFPGHELYGLVSQIRRASVSIPSNIAEGCGRNDNREFSYFLNIAAGSVSEVDYQLLLARDLGYLDKDKYAYLHDECMRIRRMLYRFIQNIT